MGTGWPHLAPAWRRACAAPRLHRRIVGDRRFAGKPGLDRSSTTIYVTATGLASTPIPGDPGVGTPFDSRGRIVLETRGDGCRALVALGPTLVATLRADLARLIA